MEEKEVLVLTAFAMLSGSGMRGYPLACRRTPFLYDGWYQHMLDVVGHKHKLSYSQSPYSFPVRSQSVMFAVLAMSDAEICLLTSYALPASRNQQEETRGDFIFTNIGPRYVLRVSYALSGTAYACP
eukprot:3932284-Rhodomonas_salina.1